jgi:hypothetical protein
LRETQPVGLILDELLVRPKVDCFFGAFRRQFFSDRLQASAHVPLEILRFVPRTHDIDAGFQIIRDRRFEERSPVLVSAVEIDEQHNMSQRVFAQENNVFFLEGIQHIGPTSGGQHHFDLPAIDTIVPLESDGELPVSIVFGDDVNVRRVLVHRSPDDFVPDEGVNQIAAILELRERPHLHGLQAFAGRAGTPEGNGAAE